MAQDFAPLLRSIWSDDDWRSLSMDGQHVYLMLLSHPDRNSAGMLSLTKRKWLRLADDLNRDRLDAALNELDAAGFLVVDEDTEEVCVRAYIRRATVYKHIRMMANALREASEVESPRIRSALGQELVRLPKLAVPEHNERMADEARRTQDRLNEVASMMCDAPPDPPGSRADQGDADGMPHGMGDGMAHPPVVVAGAVAGVGAVAHPVVDLSKGISSLVGNAQTRSSVSHLRRPCLIHDEPNVRTCGGCIADRERSA